MKKLLFLFALLIGFTTSYETKAQTSGPVVFTYSGATHDTLKDNATTLAKLGSGINGAVEDLGIHLIGTKVSGTVGAYCILQGSNDGTNYFNWFGTSADTVALTNVSGAQNVKFGVGQVLWKYAQVKVLPTQATQVVKLSGTWSVRAKK